MGVKTVKVATCDHCTGAINLEVKYVDASVYGVAFHAGCWDTIGGPRVARVLGLDDIHYYVGEERGDRAMEPYKP